MLGFASNRFFLRWLSATDISVALAQVGLFSLGDKFGVVINNFINAPFNSFWGPRRLELVLTDATDARETVARICTYATFLSTYAALLVSACAGSVIQFVADSSYWGAREIVPFVALSYVILGLETHFITGILYRGKTVYMTFISVLALGVVLLWNYLFVPTYGLLGAATSNLAGFTIRISLIYVISQRLYPLPFEIRRLASMLAVAIVFYTASQNLGLSKPYLTLLVQMGLASLFPIGLLIIGFFRERELEFARVLLKRFRCAIKKRR
jgi:O-antigen/teichoic acid export membrane protein